MEMSAEESLGAGAHPTPGDGDKKHLAGAFSETLHVFGQRLWHDDAFICGTRDSLTKLRNAVDAALAVGQARVEDFTSDGEGYDLWIVLASEEQAKHLPDPYSPEYAVPDDDDVHPWCLLRSEPQPSPTEAAPATSHEAP